MSQLTSAGMAGNRDGIMLSRGRPLQPRYCRPTIVCE